MPPRKKHVKAKRTSKKAPESKPKPTKETRDPNPRKVGRRRAPGRGTTLGTENHQMLRSVLNSVQGLPVMLRESVDRQFEAHVTRLNEERKRDEMTRLTQKMSKVSLGPKAKEAPVVNVFQAAARMDVDVPEPTQTPEPMEVSRTPPPPPAQPNRQPGRREVPDIVMSNLPPQANPIIASEQRNRRAASMQTMSTQSSSSGTQSQGVSTSSMGTQSQGVSTSSMGTQSSSVNTTSSGTQSTRMSMRSSGTQSASPTQTTQETQTPTIGPNKRRRPRQSASEFEAPRKYRNLGNGDVSYVVPPPRLNDYVMAGNNVNMLHAGAVNEFRAATQRGRQPRKRSRPTLFHDFVNRNAAPLNFSSV